jgi:hypothetical protein
MFGVLHLDHSSRLYERRTKRLHEVTRALNGRDIPEKGRSDDVYAPIGCVPDQ